MKEWCSILNENEVGDDFQYEDINEVPMESIVEIVCNCFGATMEDVRSDKRSKSLVQARTVMASLIRRFGAGSMTSLGRHIARDGTSLAKLARKSELDPDLQFLTDELSEVLITEARD